MMTAFYSVGQLWYESRVSWRLKRCLFSSRVVNTALSGIEASCPSKAQYPALTSSMVCLGKKSHGGFGTGTSPHHDQQGGFAFLETGTLRRGGLCPKTLKRAQTLVQNPAHHAQMITALFGKLPAEQQATLGENGEISPDADPWAARWVADLRELEPFDVRGVVQRMGSDVRALCFGSRTGNRHHFSKKWRDTRRSCLKKVCRSGSAVSRQSVK